MLYNIVTPDQFVSYFFSHFLSLVSSFGVNFLLDGAIFLVALFCYNRFTKRIEISQEGNNMRSPSLPTGFSKKDMLLRILLHVFVGYGGDYVGTFFFLDRWLFLTIILGLFQGVALKLTLGEKLLPKSLNLWLGVILFGILTNPLTLTIFFELW